MKNIDEELRGIFAASVTPAKPAHDEAWEAEVAKWREVFERFGFSAHDLDLSSLLSSLSREKIAYLGKCCAEYGQLLFPPETP